MNLTFPSQSLCYRIQRLYLIPTVDEKWDWRGEQDDAIVGRDSQWDSPGFNAKNLCYFLVEIDTNYILHVEMLDKRHVGFVSTNMEREGVGRSLNKLQEHLHVVEFVTDASSSIKKLLGEQYYNF